MLKINIGHSRKVGEPNYGSRGASVHFEVEVDHGLVEQPQALRQKIRELFVQAQAAVREELHAPETNGTQRPATNGHQRPATNGHQLPQRMATSSQVRAIHAIANRQRTNLSELLQELGIGRLEELSISAASDLIDRLKSAAGAGGSAAC
jgi:hypothetical protein